MPAIKSPINDLPEAKASMETTKSSDLKEKVRKILFRRNIAVLSIFLFVPLVGLTDYFFRSKTVSLSFAGLFLFVIGLQIFILNFSKCPRCHKFFFWSKLWANVFSSKCMNCGLGVKDEEATNG
ncbi:MAG: hypothetical protein ABIL58_27635 [Pseudomonadota bacterium]